MTDIGDILTYYPRWQCIVLLLATLTEVRGGLTKAEAIGRIRDRHWFDFKPEDSLPYPANVLLSREPRWITVMAWARQDCVDHKLINNDGHNNWDISGNGQSKFAVIAKSAGEDLIEVRECFLWSPAFKRRMNPSYTTGHPERKRPYNLYERDWRKRLLDTI